MPGPVIASVLLLQALQGLSDRDAAEALRCDLRWKVACGLALDDEGLHATTLTYWRGRLRSSPSPQRIFDAVRGVINATGVLKGRSKRALDSVVLDDAVATQDTVTQLIAAVRRVRRDVPGAAEFVAERIQGADLLAVHVVPSDGLTGPGHPRLAAQRTLVESLGGSYHQITGDDVAAALLQFAQAENTTQIVVGATRRGWLASTLSGDGVGARVIRDSGPIDVHLVSHERSAGPAPLPMPRRHGLGIRRSMAAGLVRGSTARTPDRRRRHRPSWTVPHPSRPGPHAGRQRSQGPGGLRRTDRRDPDPPATGRTHGQRLPEGRLRPGPHHHAAGGSPEHAGPRSRMSRPRSTSSPRATG